MIVLDVDMPVLNGPRMAHKMLMHDAGEEDIPVLLVSARHDLLQIAEQMGTPYFLRKIGDAYNLLAMIERVLGERLAPTSA